MRHAATIVFASLLASLAGLHCRGETADVAGVPPATEEPQLTGDAPATPGAWQSGSAPLFEQVAASDFASFPTAVPGSRSLITSSVRTEAGVVYAVGTFEGRISFGSVELSSRGREDVFVLRIALDRTVTWARSFGSASTESRPRVGVDETRVSVTGLTQGEMDCGGGPLPVWTSQTFFLCLFGKEAGDAVGGGSFPTGSP